VRETAVAAPNRRRDERFETIVAGARLHLDDGNVNQVRQQDFIGQFSHLPNSVQFDFNQLKHFRSPSRRLIAFARLNTTFLPELPSSALKQVNGAYSALTFGTLMHQ
jgi:hypothetical protein